MQSKTLFLTLMYKTQHVQYSLSAKPIDMHFQYNNGCNNSKRFTTVIYIMITIGTYKSGCYIEVTLLYSQVRFYVIKKVLYGTNLKAFP